MARVLVADDQADVSRLLGAVLRRRGHDVAEPTTGDEALAAVRRDRPDLAVLDVHMLGSNVLEVLGRCRRRRWCW